MQMHRARSAQLWWCCVSRAKDALDASLRSALLKGTLAAPYLCMQKGPRQWSIITNPCRKRLTEDRDSTAISELEPPDPCNPPVIVIIAAWFISARRLALSREPADDGHCNRTRVKTGLANPSTVDNRDGGPFGDDIHSEDSNNQCAS